MTEFLLAATGAVWLGILTSISPCPLATNIAAISYIGRRLEQPRRVFWTGLLYTAGRMLTYITLGMVLVAGLLAVPAVSYWLQKYMHKLIGPVLVVAGLILLEWLALPTGRGGPSRWAERLGERGDLIGSLLLGMVFAFGVMIALGMKSLGSVYQRLTSVELWMRRATGTLFILIGVYFILNSTLSLF